MTDAVVVPGARDVRAGLDAPDSAGACVVACPPNPQLGGSRSDVRLTAVADELVDRGVACLRFDYDAWDEGYGERRDARDALSWAEDRYASVGVFGYSFGGCIALLAAARDPGVGAASALAPASSLADDLDAAAELGDVTCPGQIVYGERDDAVEWEPLVDRARDAGFAVESLDADHQFVGRTEAVADLVASFLAATLD